MTTIIENGKRYDIEDGQVVAAVEAEAEEVIELKAKDRISHGKKIGTIIGLVPSVYGSTAVVRFDDGSIDELLLEDLVHSTEKLASNVDENDLEAVYASYVDLPTDTAEEIEEKAARARELNLRAKALATNGKSALADQIVYDRIVTATAVDIMDLKDAAMFAHASEQRYLETQPRYRLPEQISNAFGMNGGGDASWLADAAEEMDLDNPADGQLAARANATVNSLTREQLADDTFAALALGYARDTISSDEPSKDKFADLFAEARKQKLAAPVPKTASVKSPVDMDGNEFDMENTPVEALYGV